MKLSRYLALAFALLGVLSLAAELSDDARDPWKGIPYR